MQASPFNENDIFAFFVFQSLGHFTALLADNAIVDVLEIFTLLEWAEAPLRG